MKINYKNRLVAFVDVLGFKNLIYNDSTEKLNSYYTFIENNVKKNLYRNKMNFLLISDSIVIYTGTDKEDFEKLLILIKSIQVGLAIRGILIRGGISFGNLYVNKSKSIIVGEGLVKAYQLEHEAVYPRIIIDRSAIYKYYRNENEMILSNLTVKQIPLITVDSFHSILPDFPFINYGSFIVSYSSVKAYEKVITLIKNNIAKNSNILKYQWFRKYLLSCCDEVIECYSSLINPHVRDKQKLKHALRIVKLLNET